MSERVAKVDKRGQEDKDAGSKAEGFSEAVLKCEGRVRYAEGEYVQLDEDKESFLLLFFTIKKLNMSSF